ncbi:hypothetical protein GCM10017771_53350 [Streptomyces capitiformicae]|uniref:Uncharacterized protein n=1 Tax=Streptomyces capitiformicae TaxID=2014920 RepID=A0A919DBV1_9ACTN|nr:hypothetical protein GCM10017771_53350 [Streptomyces capitiformicae]
MVVVALLAATVTVLVARLTTQATEPRDPAHVDIPVRAVRLAASLGTAVIALSLVALSYRRVAAAIQTAPLGTACSPNRATSWASGCCSAPGRARRAPRPGSGSCTASPMYCCSPWCGGPCGGCSGCSPGSRSRRWR